MYLLCFSGTYVGADLQSEKEVVHDHSPVEHKGARRKEGKICLSSYLRTTASMNSMISLLCSR